MRSAAGWYIGTTVADVDGQLPNTRETDYFRTEPAAGRELGPSDLVEASGSQALAA